MATVKVKPWGKDQGDHVVIDEADFVEGQHELYVEGEPDDGDLTVPEIKEKLTAAGIEFPAGAKKSDLLALLSQ
jgi:hypothetical protein